MKIWLLTLLGLFLFTTAFAQFNPNPCVSGTAFHIVVIGSSTAAGAGPSPIDSAWVWRYRNYLQSINPANQVTNLAVGGFVTYRLMPDNFVPPVSRPLPDTARNITKALSLNPDAIIVNLPSNDRQYPMSEQLNNFDSLFRHSNANGVPIWICTTQPIGAPSAAAYQMVVRDSIFAQYGNFAIDFWTTIADSATGTVNPLYDADGIHLNKAGHRILFQRVVQADILTQVYTPLTVPEIGISWIGNQGINNVCGDSLTPVKVGVTNLGTTTLTSFDLDVNYINIQSPSQSGGWNASLPGGLAPCQTDTFIFFLNTYNGGEFNLYASHTFSDSNSANDSLQAFFSYTGHPTLTVIEDTGCINRIMNLVGIAPASDTVLWYDQPTGGSVIAGGHTFVTPPLSATATYYAEAVRGDLFYAHSLTTTTTSNVNWNGIMFDLIGGDSIVIDSFSMKINTLGMQGVEVFYKTGSYLGHEASAGSWLPLGMTTVNVTDPNAFVTLALGGISLAMGDTMGIHIRMQNANSTLSYRSAGSTLSVSTPELEIVTGSGISYNFAAAFFPRRWNGTVHYHHGYRPDGDCKTDRMPVTAWIQDAPVVNLGRDTIACDQVILDAGASAGMTYLWSTGATSQTLTVYESGTYWIEVENTCGNSIDAISVEVDSLPVAGFNSLAGGFSIAFQNHSSGARDYLWDFGDGNSSIIANPIYTYALPGTYTASLIVTNSCGSDTATEAVQIISTGTESLLANVNISLFPNPASGECFIQWDELPQGTPEISLFDMMGKEILDFSTEKISSQKWRLDLRRIAVGMYWVKVKAPKGIAVFKLVKN